MTEAGEKWASQVAGLHARDVEIVIRAFCDEVEKRSEAEVQKVCFNRNWDGNKEGIFVDAFDELKRELLGEPK